MFCPPPPHSLLLRQAVVALLLGDVSPSGREVTTTYPAAFVAARNMTDMQVQ